MTGAPPVPPDLIGDDDRLRQRPRPVRARQGTLLTQRNNAMLGGTWHRIYPLPAIVLSTPPGCAELDRVFALHSSFRWPFRWPALF